MTEKEKVELQAILIACGIEMEKEMRREPIWMYVPENVRKFKELYDIVTERIDGAKIKAKLTNRYGNSGFIEITSSYMEIDGEVLRAIAALADTMEIDVTNSDEVLLTLYVKDIRQIVAHNN